MDNKTLEAARRLNDLYGFWGSWGKVQKFIGGDKRKLQRPTLSSVAHGKRPAPFYLIRILGIVSEKKLRKNWKLKEYYLRLWIRRKLK
jgi:hypothetical protein